MHYRSIKVREGFKEGTATDNTIQETGFDMKRLDKEEVKRVLKKGTLDEKLRIIVDDKINRIIYQKGIVSKETIKDLFNSIPDKEVDLMTSKIEAINKVIRKRQSFSLYASKLDYLAEYINGGLERIDIYVREAFHLNALIESIKPLQSKEPEIYRQLFDRLSRQRSIDASINFIFDKETNRYKVDAGELEKQLRIAIKGFTNYLTRAKIITMILERFAKENQIESLIPYDVKDRTEGFKLDYSRNKRFSAKNYRKLLAENSTESILAAALMEDNGDIEFLFPDYDMIEIDEKALNQEIFK